MSSTGVANLALVRRLLRHHTQDEDQVIEQLIQWMSNDNATVDQWWAEDGPADYDGSVVPDPPSTSNTAIPATSAEPSIENSAEFARGSSNENKQVGIEGEKVDNQDETVKGLDIEVDEEPENVANNIAEDIPKPAKQQPDHHPKGAARRKKAQTKKQRKEAAKLKKRHAAKAAAAGVANADSASTSADHNLSQQMNRIYI
ncbi:hypothetical protein COEREDRAFT_90332 [Coemansia reversa NRRL 1564]|uniref:Uncharacterized protein n=1 Tax=Coemansia reversa (strain ATCC 12441 / NRRL 1564) TaxID=763665 RepID=A0A2G5BKV4_COERN|nr:hypothetical protein COEREDRAFT_90332 [Coemansia reversa NRRL 1564]|eukprot:PIA19621.1 hypothetical protein COEREDRAFT_90332 [Coemansia reversa NRRL 1564]